MGLFFLELGVDEVKNLCGGAEVLRVIRFVWRLLDIVFFVVPILLILFISIDFFKNVVGKDESEMHKNLSLVIKRIIMAVCLFLVPTIVFAVNSMVGSLGVDYSQCIRIARSDADLSPYELDFDPDTIQNEGDPIDISPGKRQAVPGEDGSLSVAYPDEVVENLAAFMGSEAGKFPEGFEAQLITGAIFLNNMFSDCGKPSYATSALSINKDTMCQTFSYGSMYASFYCNYTFDTIHATESEKKQLTAAAKLVLSGKFSIPKYIHGQGKLQNWSGMNVGKWGHLSTIPGPCVMNEDGEDGCSQVYAYFPVCYGGGELPDEDVFGKKVSTNFSDYKAIAEKLYNTYVK